MLGSTMRTGLLLAALSALAGCSLLNAPDDVQPGEGGGSSTTTTTSSQGGGGSGGGAECEVPEDCAELATDCLAPTCLLGSCATVPRPEGTPCGAAPTGECDLANSCDAQGSCVDHTVVDGTPCSDCAAGPGACSFCSAGSCGDCGGTRANHKTFRHPLAAAGWTFTGDWGVYREAPASQQNAAVPFARPVVGTDGNRARPYPGLEVEFSFANTPPTVLPATLEFLSWNVDEGSFYDKKAVRVSIDGGASFTTIAVCPDSGATPYPFCESFFGVRAADDWDLIQLPLPAEFVGQVGIVQFRHDTRDACCQFEQGWFVDALNFATDCGCAQDTECGHLGSSCATGTCDTTFAECSIAPQNTGNLCGSAGDVCSAQDQCDSIGFCSSDDSAFEGKVCQTCASGEGFCRGCGTGECIDCPPEQDFLYFDFPTQQAWSFTGKWQIDSCVRPNSLSAAPTCADFQTAPQPPPFLANRGSRGFSFPAFETELGVARTPPVMLPSALEFKSWHQDRGGKDDILERDNKRIRVSLDGGATWTTVANCASSGPVSSFAFCNAWATPAVNRELDVWDDISIPLGNLAGQVGIVELYYSTADGGSGWERGWMLDDLNFARCGTH